MPNLAPYAVKDMASGKPIPEATYRLRVNGFEYNDPHDSAWKEKHPNSNAKDPYLQADLIVQDDHAPVQDGEEEEEGEVVLGRHIFVTLTFKRGGDFMLRQLIEACGQGEDWMLIDNEGVSHWNDLKDAEVMGVVVIQPERKDPNTGQIYNAKNEVKKFLPLFNE